MRVAFLNPQGNFDPADSFLTEHPDFGGQLVYVKEVSLALARMGVQVDIFTRQIDDPDWPGLASPIDAYNQCGDSLRIVRIPFGGTRFLEKEKLWPHLPSFVDGIRKFYGADVPDYLTAHYADGGYSAALLQHATGLGFTFTGHSLGAQKLDKLGMTETNFPEWEKRFHFAQRIDAERLAMQRADTIITSTGQERREQYGHTLYQGAVDPGDDGRFRVIAPGVNSTIFTDLLHDEDKASHDILETRCGDYDGPFVIVSSRLDAKKNIGGVVEAWTGSAELNRTAYLALFVRGLDDPFNELGRLPAAEQEVLRPILERIDAAGLRDRVRFFNIQSQRDLAAAYRFFARRGSVFALTSFYEPFGLAPIEAAACGLAVVATRNGGPSEIFDDGSAVLVDPEDATSIAAGLADALARADDLGIRGKHRVLSRYTWDQTAREYLLTMEDNLARERPLLPVAPLDAEDRIRAYLNARN
ncbi:MAG: glycosyltransferase [Gammaproteobacteria bacterium]|nr:glycosyltransferase [Gammaproteobacteria bacterium]